MSRTFGFDKAANGIGQISRKIGEATERALDDCAMLTVRTAVEGIEDEEPWLKQNWPRDGELKESTKKARRYKNMKSKVDRPLHETGTLVMGVDFEQETDLRVVGTHPDYAVWLENGKWPFLVPSLEKAAPGFVDLFRAEIRKIQGVTS